MSTGGKSYEMDVETADEKSVSRSKLREQKEKVAKTHEELPEDQKVADKTKISYGHKFAQTEELYAAHQMERELEELARQDGMLEEEEEEQRGPRGGAKGPAMHLGQPSESALKREGKAEGRRLEDLTRGAPIGALPTASEPPPRQGFSEVVGDAQRYASMIRDSLKDLTTASIRLLRLPVDVAVIASQRLRPARS